MSLNAIISGPQAFGASAIAVFTLTLIGITITIVGLVMLRRCSK